jgi:hypothetical protein
VLLVDHDHAEVAIGAKIAERAPTTTRASPRRTRSHMARRWPSVMRECRHRDVAEARAEPAHGLRREGDLRDEHDGPLPMEERALDDAQVDLGLARARDAVQQEGPPRALLEALHDGVHGHGLPGVSCACRGRSARAESSSSGRDSTSWSTTRPLRASVRSGDSGQVEPAQQLARLHRLADLQQRAQEAVLLLVRRSSTSRSVRAGAGRGARVQHAREPASRFMGAGRMAANASPQDDA